MNNLDLFFTAILALLQESMNVDHAESVAQYVVDQLPEEFLDNIENLDTEVLMEAIGYHIDTALDVVKSIED